MDKIILALLFFAILGGALGFLLALFDKKMKVSEDPRIKEIAELLPGANCGGCGYAGCSGLAAAIVEGSAPVGKCAAATEENVAKIAAIMGVEASSSTKMRALVMCSGSYSCSSQKYEYKGIDDCVAAAKLHGGSRLCPNGCIGLGSCVRSCKFGAISVHDGVAVVDPAKCTGCGACVVGCPKNLIKLIPATAKYWVACHSPDKGVVVRGYCQVGCIDCGMCRRNCPEEAIIKNGYLEEIDYAKCMGCGLCAEKCPRGIIVSADGKPRVAVGKAESAVR